MSNRRIHPILLAVLLACLFLWTTVTAVSKSANSQSSRASEANTSQTPQGVQITDTDVPVTLHQALTGNLCAVFYGAGMRGVGSRTRQMVHRGDVDAQNEIFGGTIQAAYATWSGRATSELLNPGNTLQLTFSQPAGISQSVSVASDEASVFRSDGGFVWYSYHANLFSTLQDMGMMTISPSLVISVSEMQFEPTGTTTLTHQNHGAGVIVIYENRAHCPVQEVRIHRGGDVFHFRWSGASGPNSQVVAVDVDGAGLPRPIEFDFQVFIGGIENPNRRDAIWYRSVANTNTITAATNLVTKDHQNTEEYMRLEDQFSPLDKKPEFDNYDTFTSSVTATVVAVTGTKALLFQLESTDTQDGCIPVDGEYRCGISANWLTLVTRFPLADIRITPEQTSTFDLQKLEIIASAAKNQINSATISFGRAFEADGLARVISHNCDTPEIATDGLSATCALTVTAVPPHTTPFSVTIPASATLVLSATLVPTATIVSKPALITTTVRTNGTKNSSGPAVVTFDIKEPAEIEASLRVVHDRGTIAPGSRIEVNRPITWMLEIRNRGIETLTVTAIVGDIDGQPPNVSACQLDAQFSPDAVITCAVASGTARLVEASGRLSITALSEGGIPISDTAVTTYTGYRPRAVVDLQASISGPPATQPLEVYQGYTYTEKFTVTNVSDPGVILSNFTRIDGLMLNCSSSAIADGESTYCESTGQAVLGLQSLPVTILALAQSSYNDLDPVSANTVLTYTGIEPSCPRLELKTSDPRPLCSAPTILMAVVDSDGCPDLASKPIYLSPANGEPVLFDPETLAIAQTNPSETNYSQLYTAWIDTLENGVREKGEPQSNEVRIEWQCDVTVSITPKQKMLTVGESHTVTASVQVNGQPVSSGKNVQFTVTPALATPDPEFLPLTITAVTTRGQAIMTYARPLHPVGRGLVTETIIATVKDVDTVSDNAVAAWQPAYTMSVEQIGPWIVGSPACLRLEIQGDNSSAAANPLGDDALNFQFVGGLHETTSPAISLFSESSSTFTYTYPYSSTCNDLAFDDLCTSLEDVLLVELSDPAQAGRIVAGSSETVTWEPVKLSVTVPEGMSQAIEIDHNVDGRSNSCLSEELAVSVRLQNASDEKTPVQFERFVITDTKIVELDKHFNLSEKFQLGRPLVPLVEGCDIRLTAEESAWVIEVWIDLNNDGLVSGGEPYCIAEEPTGPNEPAFPESPEERTGRVYLPFIMH